MFFWDRHQARHYQSCGRKMGVELEQCGASIGIDVIGERRRDLLLPPSGGQTGSDLLETIA